MIRGIRDPALRSTSGAALGNAGAGPPNLQSVAQTIVFDERRQPIGSAADRACQPAASRAATIIMKNNFRAGARIYLCPKNDIHDHKLFPDYRFIADRARRSGMGIESLYV
jgi:hypothetical protein